MAGRRVRVSAELLQRALADAIDWTESLMAARSEHPNDVAAKKEDVKWLARYRRAYAALVGPQEPDPSVRTVTLAEIAAREDRWPA